MAYASRPVVALFCLASTLPLVPGCSGDDGGSGASATTGDSTATDDPTSSTGDSEATGTTATTGAETEGTTTEAGEPAVVYYRDVKPILDAACVSCHRAGDIAPFALENYGEASMWGELLIPEIEARTMPPWGASSECNTYRHDPSLSDEEIATVKAWVELGTPEGDPADEPPPVDDVLPPIEYDVELSTALYEPTIYPDEYRCFLIDWPIVEQRYITGFTIEPGERSIVHHVIAYVIPPAEIDTYTALDDADPKPGYECYGGPGGEAVPRAQWLGAWAPGIPGGPLPEGTGIHVEPGSKVALQVHYHPVEGADPDLSVVKLRTEAMVERPAYLLPFANPLWMLGIVNMTIPAGAKDVQHTFEVDIPATIDFLYPNADFGLDEPVEVSMAGLHMHELGTSGTLKVNRDGGGEQCLVNVPRWDFNWQGIYRLEESVIVDPSDTIHLECFFDNSDGDSSVAWGDGTEDEMCLGMFYVSAL